MTTLLEKALEAQKKQNNVQHTITDEHARLAVAYLEGKVTLRNIADVIGYSKGSNVSAGVYIMVARSAKKAYELGYIKTI